MASAVENVETRIAFAAADVTAITGLLPAPVRTSYGQPIRHVCGRGGPPGIASIRRRRPDRNRLPPK